MIDLTGRRVLVTGGSRGIGAACCRLFALAGATVAVHYRERRAAADSVCAELAPTGSGSHLSLGADLAEPDAVERLFQRLDDAWGGLDCLVNNAGVWRRNPLAELDAEELESTWRINLRAVFLCGRLAVPLLGRSSDGNIVNISSTAGQRGEAFYSPYAATKGAIIALTKSWSTELAPGIRANAVAPGWVDTEMCTEPFAGGGRDAIEATIPLGRVATAEEIAGPVVFLASPLARHITGEIFNVNGGSVLTG
jgi:3-oxoacyl-[acyl-carrier protein] reductase